MESFRQRLNAFSAPLGLVLKDKPPVMMRLDGSRKGKPGSKEEIKRHPAMTQAGPEPRSLLQGSSSELGSD